MNSEDTSSAGLRVAERPAMPTWGLIPAAGLGSRIQPLGFSKELLPLGSRYKDGRDHPRAVSEYLIERMLLAGVSRFCFVISPEKTDILRYYGSNIDGAAVCYMVQQKPAGLCHALFQAEPLVTENDAWIVGLPDTIWFPSNALTALPADVLSFLLFPVENPELFDAVLTSDSGDVHRINVKQPDPGTNWVWGAFKMPGRALLDLYTLWRERNGQDEYWGTLVNAYLANGGRAVAVRAGEKYLDVGTPQGFREAFDTLRLMEHPTSGRAAS